MSMQRPSSLSTIYYDPEAEPVPEPEPTPKPPKRRGRPPGSKNKPKETFKMQRNIPWYRIIRTLLWWVVAALSGLWLYNGVQGSLGQNVAYIVLAVYTIVAAFLLDRDGKKMRNSG